MTRSLLSTGNWNDVPLSVVGISPEGPPSLGGNGQGYSDTTGRVNIAPPVADPRTAVIVIFGQSYAGNMPDTDPDAIASRYAPHGNVTQLDPFNGQFYNATDPLLGTSGDGGSMWSRMADGLISSGAYDKVVLVPIAVGGSSINRWVPGGDLFHKMEETFRELQNYNLPATQIIWEQGIADAGTMSPQLYENKLASIFDTIRDHGVTAPIYSAINSVPFGANSTPTAASQAFAAGQTAIATASTLGDNIPGINLGVNFDKLPGSDYSVDGHFTTAGLDDAAKQWVTLLTHSATQIVSSIDLNNDGVNDLLVHSNTGDLQVYNVDINGDVSNNVPTDLGAVGNDWQVLAFGDFSGNANETDMLMRQDGTGAVQYYDIANNHIANAGNFGGIGTDWKLIGVGDFSSNPNETDMLMRDQSTNNVTVYDIINNQVQGAIGFGAIGQNLQPIGFGNIGGHVNETDMVMQNTDSGVYQVYEIQNNHVMLSGATGDISHYNLQPFSGV